MALYVHNTGKDDFLGRFTALPTFRSRKSPQPAVLEWFKLTRLDNNIGDILAAFEIIPFEDVGLFPLPPKGAPVDTRAHQHYY